LQISSNHHRFAKKIDLTVTPPAGSDDGLSPNVRHLREPAIPKSGGGREAVGSDVGGEDRGAPRSLFGDSGLAA
jgi:hypothetical protein